MLNYLFLRFRVAKVQAEMMAQDRNQLTVNAICQKPESIELIDFLFSNAYYKRREDAAFLIVCALMVMAINSSNFTLQEKEYCYFILKDRFARMKSDAKYCIDNFMIVGDCEEALALWESNKARE